MESDIYIHNPFLSWWYVPYPESWMNTWPHKWRLLVPTATYRHSKYSFWWSAIWVAKRLFHVPLRSSDFFKCITDCTPTLLVPLWYIPMMSYHKKILRPILTSYNVICCLRQIPPNWSVLGVPTDTKPKRYTFPDRCVDLSPGKAPTAADISYLPEHPA